LIPISGVTVQQEWRRNPITKLRKKVKEYCGKGVPKEACLLELEWCTKEIIVTYMKCKRCEEKGCHVKDNRGQGVI